jgi:peptide-methionine (R)-S-oxide reductase
MFLAEGNFWHLKVDQGLNFIQVHLVYLRATTRTMSEFKTKSNEDWKKELSAEEYRVLRGKGTERAFTGEYWDNHEKGVYYCRACHQKLFNSDTKFESGSGWPSFFAPVSKDAVSTILDQSHGMVRQEVVCSNCGGHLGHVFPDGPRPTGLRYCMNSISMKFEPLDSDL